MPPAAFADFVKKTATVPKQDRGDVFKHMLDERRGRGGGDGGDGRSRTRLRRGGAAGGGGGRDRGEPEGGGRLQEGEGRRRRIASSGAVMKANKGAPNDVVRRLVDEELAKV